MLRALLLALVVVTTPVIAAKPKEFYLGLG